MAGRGDPPEGTPEGVPGDDEYRSVVFDESFVRAARIQEFSATERMGTDARAVRTRKVRMRGSVSRQAFALLLVIALAFGAALYMGIRHPYQDPAPSPGTELTMTLIPLAPQSGEPRFSTTAQLFDHGPAAHYRTGADGVTLPAARRTSHFSESQVMQALTASKEYVVASSVNPDVLRGGKTRDVRQLLDPDQLNQFDDSLARPADDGHHAATGWMVRFDPKRIVLADPRVRVDGSLDIHEVGARTLQVTADHTFVYAVQPVQAGDGPAKAELFTVRRAVTMRFNREALRDAHLTLVSSTSEAGPQSCTADGSAYFQPILPGQSAKVKPGKNDTQAGTDPYNRDRPVSAACGVLSVHT